MGRTIDAVMAGLPVGRQARIRARASDIRKEVKAATGKPEPQDELPETGVRRCTGVDKTEE